jgi:hypothetical protein
MAEVSELRRTRGEEPVNLSQRAHRRIIGALGLALPGLLYVLAGLRPTPPLPRWQLLSSVSGYYYTGAGAAFVGVVFALALFLITYRGYAGVLADRIVGGVGGGAALVVALCPTRPPIDQVTPAWWSKPLGALHNVAAVILFVSFILFALWLFRKSDVPGGRPRPREKRYRNHFFLACGLVMIGCVLWAASSLFTKASIFLPEAVAIEAFAASWLVKGEIHAPVLRAARRLRGGVTSP